MAHEPWGIFYPERRLNEITIIAIPSTSTMFDIHHPIVAGYSVGDPSKEGELF